MWGNFPVNEHMLTTEVVGIAAFADIAGMSHCPTQLGCVFVGWVHSAGRKVQYIIVLGY